MDNKHIVRLSTINLWCNKNLVDSQLFLWKLLTENSDTIEYYTNPYDKEVEIVLLNTCWFISSWREEMFQNIETLLWKKKKICLIWCGVQYFEKVLKNNQNVKFDVYTDQELNRRNEIISNENIWYLSRNDLTLANINSLFSRSKNFGEFCRYSAPRLLTNSENNYEYLKIAEGCNNSCAFCIIPKIRWKLISLPIKSVVSEAENLLKQWIKELIILAQDTMRYWTDFSSKSQLLPLLHELDKLSYDFKYRVLYLYPDILTLKQLEDFASLKKFIPYFDIPLQHISPKLLKSMWRFYDDKMINSLLKLIRKLFSKSFIRTNIIVWFPWETEEDMALLQDFLDKDYFDNIALFEYHDESLAESSKLDWKVAEKEIHRRFEILKWIIEDTLQKKGCNKDEIWFVMWFDWDENDPVIIVRPWLHAPEIDEYYEIKLKNIKWIFSDDKNLDIWSKILYKK